MGPAETTRGIVLKIHSVWNAPVCVRGGAQRIALVNAACTSACVRSAAVLSFRLWVLAALVVIKDRLTERGMFVAVCLREWHGTVNRQDKVAHTRGTSLTANAK